MCGAVLGYSAFSLTVAWLALECICMLPLLLFAGDQHSGHPFPCGVYGAREQELREQHSAGMADSEEQRVRMFGYLSAMASQFEEAQ